MAMLLDLNPVVICAINASQKHLKEDINEGMIRHIILNMIVSYRKLFAKKYGKLVVCCDNSDIWRKDYFPFYKATRKKNREDSPLDWELIFNTLDSIQKELVEYLPYHVISVPRTEADDVIAVLAKYITENEPVIQLGWPETQEVLILSRDKDFRQLHNKTVKQWSPFDKKFMTELDQENYLIEHILRGDTSDGIPNVKSNDDSLVMKIKQKSITAKFVEEIQVTKVIPPEFKSNWDRNKRLVDLSMIPEEIQKEIINTYLNYKPVPKSQLMTYISKMGLRNLYDQAQYF